MPDDDSPTPGAPAAPAGTAPAGNAPAPTLLSRGAAPAPGASPAPSPAPDAAGAPAGQGAPSPEPPAPLAPGDWRANLPPELKDNKSLARYKDVPALAKAYTELERVKIPGPDAKPEEVANWRAAIGVPKDPSGYNPPAAPEGKTWDPASVKFANERFYQAGYTPAQAEAAYKAFAEYQEHATDLLDQRYQEGVDKLVAEMGEERFNQQATLGARLIAKYDADGKVREVLNETRLGNHPLLIKLFGAIGQEFADDDLIDGNIAGVMSDSQARAEIDSIRRDPNHPANNPSDPQHQAAHDRLMGLYKLAYGTKEVGEPART